MMCYVGQTGSLIAYGEFRGVAQSPPRSARVVWIRTGPCVSRSGRSGSRGFRTSYRATSRGRRIGACRGQGGPDLGDPGPPLPPRCGLGTQEQGHHTASGHRIRAVSAEPSWRRSSLRSGPRCSFDQDERESPPEAPGFACRRSCSRSGRPTRAGFYRWYLGHARHRRGRRHARVVETRTGSV